MAIFAGEVLVLMGGNEIWKSLTHYWLNWLNGAPTAFLWRKIWWRELLRVWVDSARLGQSVIWRADIVFLIAELVHARA